MKQKYKFWNNGTAYLIYPTWRINNETITNVLALDLCSGGTGGYASIVSGGVGQRYVALSFQPQGNRSFKFIVLIYGK